MTTNDEIRATAAAVVSLVRRKLEQPAPAPPSLFIPSVPSLLDPAVDRALATAIAASLSAEFDWFTEPDPDDVTEMLAALPPGPAAGPDPVLEHLRGAPDRGGLLLVVERIRPNQTALVAELAAALLGWRALLRRARTAVVGIGRATLVALSRLPDGVSDPVALGVAAAVADAMAAAAPGTPEVVIRGGGVDEVVASMRSAIGRLKADMAVAEELLIGRLADELAGLARQRQMAERGQVNDLMLVGPNGPTTCGVARTP